MQNPLKQYTRWLHTRWPAGRVEKLPVVQPDGSTNVPGFYIVGDLTGIPLLKFSVDTGARAVMTIANDPGFAKRSLSDPAVRDVAIVGGGVSGFAAAKQAKKQGLTFELFEAAEPFSTISNFPAGKPIFTYPTGMTPAGDLQFHDKAAVKEGLLEDLHDQTLDAGITPTTARVESIKKTGGVFELILPGGENIKAHRVIVGIGRSGNFRKLGVPGEEKNKVYNRLHDPRDFCGQDIVVVGGGDSAMETAIALATCGSRVTLSYRKPEFSRPKPENIAKLQALATDPTADFDVETVDGDRVTTPSGAYLGPKPTPLGTVNLMMASGIQDIRNGQIDIKDSDGNVQTLPNESVFTMIGREPPLDFFRKSGVRINGEWSRQAKVGFVLFLAFAFWLYHWKGDYNIPFGLKQTFNDSFLGLDPKVLWDAITPRFGGYFAKEGTLGHTLAISASGRSFYYTLAYAACVLVFGIRRIRRRKTPYIKVQTLTLTAIQVVPLFLLPEIVLPYLGHNGLFGGGVGKAMADTFFPEANYGHGREYWRAYGFILAWPLMAWNWFTDQPMWGWLILGFLQTFVAIPLMIRFWGKGAYCGWICSCGALAETLGDTHRHKMPHGPFWNRLNMIGQVFLAFAFAIMAFRIIGWVIPGKEDFADKSFKYLAKGGGLPILNFAYMVDLLWAGVLGVGMYFHFSGRVWCRFACPLAALMHIYARLFSRFAILSEKKKCISCNVCTSVCHQGIDVMNFANKGLPMQDAQCVRCSACVQSCPTGVLSFGQVDRESNVIAKDPSWLIASPVQMAELTVNGKKR